MRIKLLISLLLLMANGILLFIFDRHMNLIPIESIQDYLVKEEEVEEKEEIDLPLGHIFYGFMDRNLYFDGIVQYEQLETIKLDPKAELLIEPFSWVKEGDPIARVNGETIKSTIKGKIWNIYGTEDSIEIEMLNDEDLYIESEVSFYTYQSLNRDQTVQLILEEEQLEATIDQVLLNDDYTYTLILTLKNVPPHTSLWLGERVEMVQLREEKKLTYFISLSLLTNPIGENTYRIKIYNPTLKDNQFYTKDIVIGSRNKYYAEIISGNVHHYEKVIIENEQ